MGILYNYIDILAVLQEGNTEGGEKELQQLGLNQLGGKNTLHPAADTQPAIVELWSIKFEILKFALFVTLQFSVHSRTL